jgi:hypothetical protein
LAALRAPLAVPSPRLRSGRPEGASGCTGPVRVGEEPAGSGFHGRGRRFRARPGPPEPDDLPVCIAGDPAGRFRGPARLSTGFRSRGPSAWVFVFRKERRETVSEGGDCGRDPARLGELKQVYLRMTVGKRLSPANGNLRGLGLTWTSPSCGRTSPLVLCGAPEPRLTVLAIGMVRF